MVDEEFKIRRLSELQRELIYAEMEGRTPPKCSVEEFRALAKEIERREQDGNSIK